MPSSIEKVNINAIVVNEYFDTSSNIIFSITYFNVVTPKYIERYVSRKFARFISYVLYSVENL